MKITTVKISEMKNPGNAPRLSCGTAAAAGYTPLSGGLVLNAG